MEVSAVKNMPALFLTACLKTFIYLVSLVARYVTAPEKFLYRQKVAISDSIYTVLAHQFHSIPAQIANV